MITGKIDVTKIDKASLYRGKKGTYLDLVLIETPNDKYGNDYMIKQDIPKARRDAGEQGPIVGNAKLIGSAKPTEPTDDLAF